MAKNSVFGAFEAVRTTMLAIAFVALFVILNGDWVKGRRSISEEEDLEFERQLRILNKPASRTIETEYGDVYNCVDIFKQPAFGHPLLKDHKIQIPEDYWLRMKNVASKPSKFGLKEGCPLGTVPIRRITKEDLIRAKSVSKKNSEFYGRKEQGNGFEFAGIQTIKTPGRVYHGAGANIQLYNPAVQPREFSSAIISIESGPLNERNYIQCGWTTDNCKTGCFNTTCKGFVHCNANVPLDFVFNKISKVDGESVEVRLGVYQQKVTKVCNMVIGEDEELIGYWPPEIFSHLASGADYIQWGGQVYSPNPIEHSPQMGSGILRIGKESRTCYFRRVIDIDATYTPENPDNAYIQQADSRCYIVGNNSYKDDINRYSFTFGGTGGSSKKCFG